jgi:2OG-Fe(II) oxygenase superfamily
MTNISAGVWWEHEIPFRHFRATQVLNSTDYQSIASEFSQVLQDVTGNPKHSYMVSKASNYDALIVGMNKRLSARFKPFFETTWIKTLSQLLGMPFLARIDGALHAHPINSKTGWVHTDFCSAWFDESAKRPEGELLFPDRSRCEYFTGKTRASGVIPKEYARVASMIYFLCNDGWQEGEGGETGLYGAAHPGPYRQVGMAPPVNNSLLLFECSPHSFHSFITNRVRARNSLILFLHSTVEFAESRWGASSLQRRGPD